MPEITVGNISDETHRALKLRAARHGRSIEAEMREILESVVGPAEPLRLGSALSTLSRNAGLTNADIKALEQGRGRGPATPPSFE